MKILKNYLLVGALSFLLPGLNAQTPRTNAAQQLVYSGLRSVAQQGQINSVKSDAVGNLFLLLDQKDGVRVLKTDNAGGSVLAQALLGSKGDIGLGLALDPSGNVYVAGSSTSASLTATGGAAIPTRTDGSTQSFVAKFDSNLATQFVTFTGGSKIAAQALTATSDAVFVTGITYASNLPVTANGILQSPANGSTQNGFVEKFSSNGSLLLYATYLSGSQGDTTPTAIVADAADSAYIVGSTSASGFPTVAALVPSVLSNPSGFLMKLSPAGDAIVFSTFVPGSGLTSVALDISGKSLLVSGSVAQGQFPVSVVTMPITNENYQVLLRLSLDGSSLQNSILIAPGTHSYVAAAANGAAWVDGTLTDPILPLPALSDIGNGFAVRVTSSDTIDETMRVGGAATGNHSFASIPSVLTSIAVDPADEVVIAGAIQPTASSSLLATETYDLPLRNAPTAALPSAVADTRQSAAMCSGSLCAGSAAYLTKVNPTMGAALTFSVDDIPFVKLRNLGTSPANSVQITTSAGTPNTNCPTALAAGAQCDILVIGGSAGLVSVSSSNAQSQSVAFPAYSTPANTFIISPRELDFGIQTSKSLTANRVITITNLGTNSQTFTSVGAGITVASFVESSSDCTVAASPQSKVLAPGGTCHISIGFIPFNAAVNDGFAQSAWNLGNRSVILTGYSQAASVSISASEVDFGTQFSGGLRLPRFLYLSNSSTTAQTHTPVSIPGTSPFTISDGCGTSLLPGSICQIRIDYLAVKTTSTDSVTLTLDGAATVLVKGATLPPAGVTASGFNPSLSVAPTSIKFANPIAVTSLSPTTQTVSIINSGASPFALNLALTGDFVEATSCGASLGGGKTCAVVVTFAPSQPGSRSGLLAITAGAGTSPVYVQLSGTATVLLTPTNGVLDFGSVPVGQPQTQFYKVSQPFASLTVTASGPYTTALIEDLGFGPGIPPASIFSSMITGVCHNCYVAVRFLPTAAGSQPGFLTLSSAKGGSPYVISLTGAGISSTGLLLTPTLHDFGTVPIHSTSGSVFFTLTNQSAAGAAIALSVPVAVREFALTNDTTAGQPCAGTLAYGASCVVSVGFAPTATGIQNGNLTISGGSLVASATLNGLGAVDPGLAIRPLMLTFANVPGPAATVQSVTLLNNNSSVLLVGMPTASSANFFFSSACASLAPNAGCVVTVSFVPGNAIANGTLVIPVSQFVNGSVQMTNYTVSLNGTYVAGNAGLQITPGQVQFGPTATGMTGLSQQFNVANFTTKMLGLNLNLPRQYSLANSTCANIASNAACSFTLIFTPLTNGEVPGTIVATGVPSDGTAPISSLAYVEGYGLGHDALTISGGLIVSGVYNFGQVSSGQTLTQIFLVTNAGASANPITVHRVSSGPPFLSTTDCGSALPVLESCHIFVTYSPVNRVAAGSVSPATIQDAGALTIQSDAASSPNVISLTGLAGPDVVAASSGNPLLATYVLSQNSLTFAPTTVGSASTSQIITLTNTGSVTLHVTSSLAGPDFTAVTNCATVAPTAACSIRVSMTPQTAGAHIAALEISSDSSTSLEFVSLIGTASVPPVMFSPASLSFGTVLVGATATLAVQVTNTSAAAAVFTSVSATGDYSVGGTCPSSGGSVAPNGVCTLLITFAPTATGIRSSSILVATSATPMPLVLPVTGFGIQSKLLVSPAALDFGSLVVGASSKLTLMLRNTGSVPFTALSLTTSGDYAVTIPCASTILAPGGTCSVQVTFLPTATGGRPGTLTVGSSDPGSPTTISLSGTGIASGSFTLMVDGGSSSSATVVSGQPAVYHLSIAPTNNFAGAVALTCSAVSAGLYVSCSLQPGSVSLTGSGAMTAIATLNTVTSIGGKASLSARKDPHLLPTFICLLIPGVFAIWTQRRRLRNRVPLLLSVILTAWTLIALGCGSGTAGDPNLRYAPAGMYQYAVTASNTSGLQVSQTVTLNLTVLPR